MTTRSSSSFHPRLSMLNPPRHQPATSFSLPFWERSHVYLTTADKGRVHSLNSMSMMHLQIKHHYISNLISIISQISLRNKRGFKSLTIMIQVSIFQSITSSLSVIICCVRWTDKVIIEGAWQRWSFNRGNQWMLIEEWGWESS